MFNEADFASEKIAEGVNLHAVDVELIRLRGGAIIDVYKSIYLDELYVIGSVVMDFKRRSSASFYSIILGRGGSFIIKGIENISYFYFRSLNPDFVKNLIGIETNKGGKDSGT